MEQTLYAKQKENGKWGKYMAIYLDKECEKLVDWLPGVCLTESKGMRASNGWVWVEVIK